MSRRGLSSSIRRAACLRHRPLRVETLEGRRLLAVFMVENLDDAGPGSLRQAVLDANAAPGADEVRFDSSLFGRVSLVSGQIDVTDSLSINGGAPPVNVTIDAGERSRIFDIAGGVEAFDISRLTLTGGLTTGDNADAEDTTHSGGAIRSLTGAEISLTSMRIIGNGTTGAHASGGAVFTMGVLRLVRSTISGNSTSGDFARGGGLHVDRLFAENAYIADNVTGGEKAHGGGVSSNADLLLMGGRVFNNRTNGDSALGSGVFGEGFVTIERSNISRNEARGANSRGGGVFSEGPVTIERSAIFDNFVRGANSAGGGVYIGGRALVRLSTIADNRAEGDESRGGGLFLEGGALTIEQSTVSGNSAVRGGGLYAKLAATEITLSTITTNQAERGAGLALEGGATTIDGSIIAGNTAATLAPDLEQDRGLGFGGLTVRYSLIGDSEESGLTEAPLGSPDADGALIGGPLHGAIDPRLDSLSYLDGSPRTHALLGDSPAIDAGDPAFSPPPEFDQRGAARVFGGRIDMGSFEFPPGLPGDTDGDGVVDLNDLGSVRNNIGARGEADGSLPGDAVPFDGVVDLIDLNAVRNNFGATLPPFAPPPQAAPAPQPAPAPAVASSILVDLDSMLGDASSDKTLASKLAANQVTKPAMRALRGLAATADTAADPTPVARTQSKPFVASAASPTTQVSTSAVFMASSETAERAMRFAARSALSTALGRSVPRPSAVDQIFSTPVRDVQSSPRSLTFRAARGRQAPSEAPANPWDEALADFGF